MSTVIKIIDHISESPHITQEVMVVYDKVHWIRMFWNNLRMVWQVSLHNKKGWGKCLSLNRDELLQHVDNIGSEGTYVVQYKSPAGTTIIP